MPDPDGTGGNNPDEPNLWLKEIRHTGYTGSETVAMPAVVFTGIPLRNRVSVPRGQRSIVKYRVGSIRNESGGRISVVYGHADGRACGGGDANKSRQLVAKECFVQKYADPASNKASEWVWFHKYVVEQVWVLDDSLSLRGAITVQQGDSVRTTGSETIYDYTYQRAPGWRFDKSPNMPVDNRSWSDWRGYESVIIRTRQVVNHRPAAALSKRKVTLFRGMSRSRVKLTGSGQYPKTYVDTAENPANSSKKIEDLRRFEGQVAEEIELGPDNKWMGRKYYGYQSLRTANNAGSGNQAFMVLRNLTRTYTRDFTPNAQWKWRRHTVAVGYNLGGAERRGVLAGAVEKVYDYGGGTEKPQHCTRTSWASSEDKWVRAPFVVSGWDVAENGQGCGRMASQVFNFYDNNTQYSDGTHAISAGQLTLVRRRMTTAADSPHEFTSTQYDAYGRVTRQTDARGKATDISYNTASGLGLHDRVTRVETQG